MNRKIAHVALLSAAALVLTACGGGGGGGGTAKPPVTLNGVSFWAPNGQNSNFVIRESEGGVGKNFGNVIYVRDDFPGEILSEQTGSTATTKTFRIDSNNFATLAVPDGDPDFTDIRFLNLVYREGGTTYGSLGVIGRFTTLTQMASATGSATYTGTGTAIVTGLTGAGQYSVTGNTQVSVTFGGGGDVDVVLNGFSATSGTAPFDRVEINNATINGNRFEGGTLLFRTGGSGGTIVLTGGTRDHGGIFAGWNDGDNPPNTPAEVGGAFTVTAGSGDVASGIYAGD